jgi:hypothetical protein
MVYIEGFWKNRYHISGCFRKGCKGFYNGIALTGFVNHRKPFSNEIHSKYGFKNHFFVNNTSSINVINVSTFFTLE